MTDYNTFYGGNRRKYIEDSTLASGLEPFTTIGYAGHLPRGFWMLKQDFDGNTEKWQWFMQQNTAGGAGFVDGDTLTMAVADPDCRFDGAAFILKKDLPDGVGLTLTIRSNLADPTQDSFKEKSIELPAGSKAGSAYIPPQGSSQDYSVGGLSAVVTFKGTSTGAAITTLNLCFGIALAVLDFSPEEPCTCAVKACPADYPAPTCIGQPYVNVSGFGQTSQIGGTTSAAASGSSGTAASGTTGTTGTTGS